MKKIFLFLFLTTIFSCTSNKTYYEGPIKIWLDKNLNDISSYESVEFLVVDSTNFGKLNSTIEAKFLSLINVIQRKTDLTSSFISSIADSTAKRDLIQNRKLILEKINGNIINLPKIIELDNDIRKNLLSIDKNPIDQIAMLEGIDNRIATEKDQLENELTNIGTSINVLPNELKNGQFVFHKFRSKNSLGAIVLSSVIFKLDYNKINIEKAVIIE